jgi:hypothetical protein
VVHLYEDAMVRRGLRAAIAQGRNLGYPWLEDIVRRSGARRGMSEVKIEQRLEPYMPEVVEGSMRTMARAAIERGIVPVLVYVPLANEALAHRLIAERLVEVLEQEQATLGLETAGNRL